MLAGAQMHRAREGWGTVLKPGLVCILCLCLLEKQSTSHRGGREREKEEECEDRVPTCCFIPGIGPGQELRTQCEKQGPQILGLLLLLSSRYRGRKLQSGARGGH